eukprot:TRINITY_DN17301_c0_g1_i1.p1 TRINITY_DN17301_c0_g1~~TRINITY_DN17301_c0_g1_i1.p1  ORF type:complete len:139 (-),score=1.95 TRINITY_DN17301_c0_g1_i1:235-651(-)
MQKQLLASTRKSRTHCFQQCSGQFTLFKGPENTRASFPTSACFARGLPPRCKQRPLLQDVGTRTCHRTKTSAHPMIGRIIHPTSDGMLSERGCPNIHVAPAPVHEVLLCHDERTQNYVPPARPSLAYTETSDIPLRQH